MKKLSSQISPNDEKGFAPIFSILVLALLLVGTASINTVNQPKKQIIASKSTISEVKIINDSNDVLGESDDDDDDDSSDSGSSGSSKSGSSKSESSKNETKDSNTSIRKDSTPKPTSTPKSNTTNKLSTPKPTIKPKLTPPPATLSSDDDTDNYDVNEDENEDDDDEDEKEASSAGRTRFQVRENQTRLEQEIFVNGVRKRIEMRNENGKIRVIIKTEDAAGNETEQKLDLNPEDGIAKLKVEENGVERNVKVRASNNRFVIEQSGFGGTEASASATTDFPITVDAEKNTITVTTPLGNINVQQLPATAIQNILDTNVIDRVESTELTEPESDKDKQDPSKQVVYRIKGVKETKFLGLFKIDAPILTEVSAITGQQTFTQQPWFLNAFGFLFTK